MMKCEYKKISVLLELSASNDLIGFKRAIEEEGQDINEVSLWYGRRIGSRKMGFEERTPLLIASLFGSKDVVNYIIKTGRVDVNKAFGSDGVTPVHCAIVGGSLDSIEVIRALLDASADTNSLEANGNQPIDLIVSNYNSAFGSRKKTLESLLKGSDNVGEIGGLLAQTEGCNSTPRVLNGIEKKEYKKEYSVDYTLPDIKNEMFGTDEFRMYNFKVTPCSRAYSHDWTECPFVHPAENARRRDPRKYHYSCVPCPEFRKGSCKHGDNCEYAHGIFESWLHPAQYRTRLCKDETNCNRKVCFFAHRPEELRPLYASTGSTLPSPMSYLDTGSMSAHNLGSPSILIPSSTSSLTSTPSDTPSLMDGVMWPSQSNTVPTLQLHGSRLKSARHARNIDLNMEQLELETHHHRQNQQLINEIHNLSSPTNWNNTLSTCPPFSPSTNRTRESKRFEGISLDVPAHQLPSPNRASYWTNLLSSPMRGSQSFEFDTSRSSAFTNLSQSFIEQHTSINHHHSGISSPASSASALPSTFSSWGSSDGKLDWSVQGEELNKLRKSSSWAFNLGNATELVSSPTCDEPNVSWVQSLAKDAPFGQLNFENKQRQQQCHLNTESSATFPAWVEQMYMEQEQTVA